MGKPKPKKTKNRTIIHEKEKQGMVTREAKGVSDSNEANDHTDMNTLQASINAIHAEIKEWHVNMKKELNETVEQDLMEKLGNFKRDQQ